MSPRQLCCFLSLLLVPQLAPAQSTLDLRLGERASVRLQRLVALGAVDTAFAGQQPYTMREAARMIASARRRLDAGEQFNPTVEPLVAALERELRDPRRTALIDHAALSVRSSNASPRPIPGDSLGAVDAWMNPLATARGTEPIARGTVASADSRHSLRIGDALVLDARPRVTTVGRDADGPDRATMLDLVTAQARAAVGKFTVDVGRGELALGYGEFGTPGVSGAGPPLTMLRVSNDVPLTLPLLSRLLGPVRGTLFVADLGREQNFPHARLAGWKGSFLPHRRFELGVTVLSQQGGGGAPDAPFHERALDLLPLYDAIFVSDRDFQISNKFSGIDARFQTPWNGLQLHGELLLDDWDERRLRSTWWEDAGYVIGGSAPIRFPGGGATLVMEGHHTGIRMYRHTQFTTGLATTGRLIGNPLGPNANAIYMRLARDRGTGAVWEVDAAWEMRSGRRYRLTGGFGDETLRFHEYECLPHEYRRRAVARRHDELGDRYPFARALRTLLEGGVEWVRNEAHSDSSRWNVVARFGAELHF